jgi:hypothetical protein
LVRTLGGFSEPIYNVHAITNVKVAGTPTGAYTQAGGLITFSVARRRAAPRSRGPGPTWRVRFAEDTATFEEFANALLARTDRCRSRRF